MAEKVKRISYRLNVPVDDEVVNCWIKAQNDKNISIREIIKEYVEKNGVKDVFASTVKTNVVMPQDDFYNMSEPLPDIYSLEHAPSQTEEVILQAKEDTTAQTKVDSEKTQANNEALQKLQRMQGLTGTNSMSNMKDLLNN